MASFEVKLPIGSDHPAYAGHFPGRPILPGVVLLAEALAAVESQSGRPAQEWSIASAKFLRTVSPGAPLTLMHESVGPDKVSFEIRSGGELVASGTLSTRERGERG
jgi:3-hydroxymyristoyl/3-hydroxydecanoyl-(acyl carrier protein) dehydratase